MYQSPNFINEQLTHGQPCFICLFTHSLHSSSFCHHRLVLLKPYINGISMCSLGTGSPSTGWRLRDSPVLLRACPVSWLPFPPHLLEHFQAEPLGALLPCLSGLQFPASACPRVQAQSGAHALRFSMNLCLSSIFTVSLVAQHSASAFGDAQTPIS